MENVDLSLILLRILVIKQLLGLWTKKSAFSGRYKKLILPTFCTLSTQPANMKISFKMFFFFYISAFSFVAHWFIWLHLSVRPIFSSRVLLKNKFSKFFKCVTGIWISVENISGFIHSSVNELRGNSCQEICKWNSCFISGQIWEKSN